MSITVGNHTGAASGDTNNVTTSSIDTTGNSLLVVMTACFNTAVVSMSDSKSNTWHARTHQSSASFSRGQIFYAWNPTVGTGHTFTASTSGGFPAICVIGFSGVKIDADPYDVENGTSTTSAASLACGSVTPSEDGEVIIAGIAWSVAKTMSIDSSFTITDQINYVASVNFGCGMAYLIQGSKSAVNPTWSWTGATEAAVVDATFKSAPISFPPVPGQFDKMTSLLPQ